MSNRDPRQVFFPVPLEALNHQNHCCGHLTATFNSTLAVNDEFRPWLEKLKRLAKAGGAFSTGYENDLTTLYRAFTLSSGIKCDTSARNELYGGVFVVSEFRPPNISTVRQRCYTERKEFEKQLLIVATKNVSKALESGLLRKSILNAFLVCAVHCGALFSVEWYEFADGPRYGLGNIDPTLRFSMKISFRSSNPKIMAVPQPCNGHKQRQENNGDEDATSLQEAIRIVREYAAVMNEAGRVMQDGQSKRKCYCTQKAHLDECEPTLEPQHSCNDSDVSTLDLNDTLGQLSPRNVHDNVPSLPGNAPTICASAAPKRHSSIANCIADALAEAWSILQPIKYGDSMEPRLVNQYDGNLIATVGGVVENQHDFDSGFSSGSQQGFEDTVGNEKGKGLEGMDSSGKVIGQEFAGIIGDSGAHHMNTPRMAAAQTTTNQASIGQPAIHYRYAVGPAPTDWQGYQPQPQVFTGCGTSASNIQSNDGVSDANEYSYETDSEGHFSNEEEDKEGEMVALDLSSPVPGLIMY